MAQHQNTCGVILAGGLARRMNGQDKGLVLYQGKALVSYALAAMQQVASQVFINANRNQAVYAQFGVPVIADQTTSFDGPLAGILSAMLNTERDILVVMPCDSPLIQAQHLEKLLNALAETPIEIAVAFDGERLHPVFLALKTALKNSLANYLASGERKIDRWLIQHQLIQVDFSATPEVFLNINTLTELSTLEQQSYRPELSNAGLSFSHTATAIDESGQARTIELVDEQPLTLYVDKQEIVTLMTMGTHPELLTLGYLKNQGFFTDITDIKAVQVDWETQAVAVVTRSQQSDFSAQLAQRTVTTGCGQGTVFGRLIEKLSQIQLPKISIKQSTLYAMLNALQQHNEVYKKAGAVHGCALCCADRVEFFVEDVGRHNAVDAIAGYMWLNRISGADKIFYTTGRLTSEMVIKVAQMGVPVLLSRSGATQMGLAMAKQAGVILISRAKGKHFLVLNGIENLLLDCADSSN